MECDWGYSELEQRQVMALCVEMLAGRQVFVNSPAHQLAHIDTIVRREDGSYRVFDDKGNDRGPFDYIIRDH